MLALAAYVVVVFSVLAPTRGAVGGPGAAALPPRPAAAGQAPAERAAPELAATQKTRADGTLAADRALGAALGGVPYKVVKSGSWTTSGANGAASRVLGAAYVVAPDRPVALKGAALPTALYDQTERTNPPYQAVTNRVTAAQVSQFLVLVDLEKDQVVSIVPGPGSQDVETTPPPGFKRAVPAPTDGGQ
jgi:hypothetical protein